MLGKLFQILILGALLYFLAGFCYRMAATSSVQAKLAAAYGPDVVVENLQFTGWYLATDDRAATADVTTKSQKTNLTERGLAITTFRVNVRTTGRFWPETAMPTGPATGR